MSGQIGEDKIHEVRDRTDIVELVSRYVNLKRSGANHMGLCPFHSEKSPSFSVHGGRQFFHCFGCGEGGDVISFLMKIEGLTFPDAVRRLADQAGIDLEERQLSPEEERQQQLRQRLFRVNRLATDYFHQLLMQQPAGEVGRQYLKQRGYGRTAAAEYQLGYAADLWEGLSRHLQQQGVAVEDARTLGLIRPGKQQRGDYDLFRGRLMFPIFDLSGQVVAFGGRVLDDGKPKYINSPESPIYHKGRVLFGLYQARQAMRQASEVILVEGYFDQLALYRAGFPQVVATCGTALTSEHARLLKRYVKRVLLLFDQDSAGLQATFKAMAALQEEELPAAVIELPSGEDPDSFVQQQGAEAFRQRLEQARPAMELFMEVTLAEAGAGVSEKVRAAETVIARIAELRSSMEQDLYLKDLASRSGIELPLLREKLLEIGRQPKKRTDRQPPQYPESTPPPADYPVGLPPEEPHFSSAEPQQEVSPAEPAPNWTKAEGMLLCLLLHRKEAREALAVAEMHNYFSSPLAIQVAELLLSEPAAVEEGETLSLAAFTEDQQALLLPLYQSDPEQFAGDVAEMLTGCQAALQRQQKRQRREELLSRLREVETQNSETYEELLREFKKLK